MAGYIQVTSKGITTAAGVDLTTPAFAQPTVSGNTIVVTCTSDAGAVGNIYDLKDNYGNTWVQLEDRANSMTMATWYCQNIIGGPGHTLTMSYHTASANAASIMGMEFSGVETIGSALDKQSNAKGTSTAPDSDLTAVTTAANELIVGSFAYSSTTTTTAGAGFTNLQRNTAGGAQVCVAMESKVVAATGTQHAGMTLGASKSWIASVVTLKLSVDHFVTVNQATETDTAQPVLRAFPVDASTQLPPAYGPGIVGAPSSGMQVVAWAGAIAGNLTHYVTVGQTLDTQTAQVIQGPLVRTTAIPLTDIITPVATLPPASDIGQYTEDEIDAALHADSRTARIRYELLDNSLSSIKFLDDVAMSGDVTYAHDNDIKRTATFTIIETPATIDINYEHDRIRPYYDLLMPDGLYARFPLGVFLLSSPTRSIKDGLVTRDVAAYDLTAVLTQNVNGGRYALAIGVNVIATVIDILDEHGLDHDIGDSDEVLTAPKDWDPGTQWYQIVADLLTMIAWRPLYFDANGTAHTTLNTTPMDRQVDFTYQDDALSVLDPEVTEELDLWDVPNIWVLIAAKVDGSPIVARFDNNNPDSPTSTVNRGRNVPKVVKDGIDATTQDALNALAANMAFEDSQVYQTATFTTAIMPTHGDYNVIHLIYGALGIDHVYGETDWSFSLESTSQMTHSARRVVDVREPLEDDAPVATGTYIVHQAGESETAQHPVAFKSTSTSTFTKTYAATWYRSFEQDNSIGRTPEPGVLYAGASGSDSWGVQKSLIGFDFATIQADLTGATIIGMWVTFRQIHTWFNAGATWYIGTHNYSSKPTTWSSATVKPRRFTLHVERNTTYKMGLSIAVGNEFKAGTSKGIAFGPPASSSQQYYGYTDNSPLILTIEYKK